MKNAHEPSLSPYLDERERRINEDYDWCLHDVAVRKKHGGRAVVAYQRKVWGAGKTYAAAWAAARRKPGCPPRHEFALVIVPHYLPEAETR